MKTLRHASVCLLLILLTAACGQESTEAPGPATTQPAEVPLIARAELFGNPSRAQARISPDGRWLSWLAPHQGVLNVWIAPAAEPDAARPITADRGRGIRQHFWSPDSRYVLYPQDKGGNENHQIYAVDVTSGELRNLTPVEDDVRAVVQGISRKRPDVVLIGLNDRDPRLVDLYEVELATGKRTLVAENPGFGDWTVDNQLRPRLASREQPGGTREVLRRTPAGEWVPLFEIAPEDALTTNFVAFDFDDERVFGLSSRGRETAALVAIDPATGVETLLGSDKRADVSGIVMDPQTLEPLAYAVNHQRTEWFALTDAAARDLKLIQAALDGDIQIVDSNLDGSRRIIHVNAPDAPGAYYLFERATGALRQLFTTRPELADAPLQPMQPLIIAARDGLELVAYLTLPAGSDPDGDGRPDKPYPMVLYVHGGPWARDNFGFRSDHQWLANRGYAVLSVNYRGSTGFGKSFVNAAIGEFAGKMHTDLLDAVNYSIAQKIATPDKVAIMGGSYGGYATLVGLTFTPDTFACGVDLVGPSSLITLIESFPAYWAPFLESSWYRFVGNPADETERADLYNRSPISRVDDIRRPLMIAQGENDPRVTKQESDQLVAAMAERNLPVTYLNYPDEGHGFARPENRMSYFAVAEAFLSHCLGGRYEAIGDDFEGSSVQVLHGADYVPGLKAALTVEGPVGP